MSAPSSAAEHLRPLPGASGDEIESSLLQALRLIESTVSLHRNGADNRSLQMLPGRLAASGTARLLIDGAQRRISYAGPHPPQGAEDEQAMLSGLHAAYERGVRVRMLYSAPPLDQEESVGLTPQPAGWEVRVAGGDVQEALIVDGRVALLRGGDRHGAQAAVTEDPATVRALDLLLAGTWQTALTPTAHRRLTQRLRRTPTQRVLGQLRDGATDEAAAPELDMSLRTYRRLVAEIKCALGVNSRFQAGVRAVELGLLPDGDRARPELADRESLAATLSESLQEALHPGSPAQRHRQERPRGSRGDELERALLEIRTLIEETRRQHASQLSHRSLVCEVTLDDEALVTAVRELVEQAERSVDVVLAADPARTRKVHAALAQVAAEARAGVRVRVLCNQPAVEAGCLSGPGAGRPWEVRVARMPALTATIVDDRAALVSTESPAGRRASMIRAPGVIRTLNTLFAGVWRNAVRTPGQLDFGGRVRTETVRRILQKLQIGVTDEVAARELSVSVRTYRRHVAEIMAVLGATSRFQAGVRAAELGLLSEPACADSQLPASEAPRQPGER
ncbi:hypothetical protein SAMN06297387_106153 [Streptomyces zhaozhouensis]|uniref:HTH luxR-type domain-containing protein n=1 Tax=Streptomyces zhaozhouensis TaxID=1300267 RepID=A0A286DVA0_9ACTN|nr:hypothetical protein [Streptomyces zhaozhouensis]SOD62576.1 hypothetical protein SAMN06297387_106153 [Streptomyces zhaozhouensis]